MEGTTWKKSDCKPVLAQQRRKAQIFLSELIEDREKRRRGGGYEPRYLT